MFHLMPKKFAEMNTTLNEASARNVKAGKETCEVIKRSVILPTPPTKRPT